MSGKIPLVISLADVAPTPLAQVEYGEYDEQRQMSAHGIERMGTTITGTTDSGTEHDAA